ncbi:hypothetical protein QA641_38230 [Bradyrhizobium sp. CB1650]|uniref:hypothetical protein n=1 Tax=Bradyrhizobium sp. CB1650 TaxID=3039153 RepID=UPI0024351CE5|nr:hypothetical protein [Bradyrhizobium sp. CB1650]WGD51262.1 hypothetical protein QA641_38230 [Bradyrhizobium sp. CB1650]
MAEKDYGGFVRCYIRAHRPRHQAHVSPPAALSALASRPSADLRHARNDRFVTYSRPAARHPSGAQIKPGDRKQLYQRHSCDRSHSEEPAARAAVFFCMCLSPANPPNGNLPFSEDMQARRLHRVEAKPKIKPTDHPTLDLEIAIEGYGHLRGKACPMLNRTSDGV